MQSERPGPTLNNAASAAESLRVAIATGQVPGGSAVLEEEWAARLGMSRTPVREAIGRLVGEGLLVKNGRQAYVFQPSLADLIEVYEVRLALEKQAAIFAASARTDDDIATIRGEFARLEVADSPRDWFDAHESFHMAVFSICRRNKLTSLIHNLRMQSEPYVRLAVHADPQFREASIRDHRDLVEALVCGDCDRIEKVTGRHLNATCDQLRRLLDLTSDIGGVKAWRLSPRAERDRTS